MGIFKKPKAPQRQAQVQQEQQAAIKQANLDRQAALNKAAEANKRAAESMAQQEALVAEREKDLAAKKEAIAMTETEKKRRRQAGTFGSLSLFSQQGYKGFGLGGSDEKLG